MTVLIEIIIGTLIGVIMVSGALYIGFRFLKSIKGVVGNYFAYKFNKIKGKRKVKKGILKRNRRMLYEGIYILKTTDMVHNSHIVNKVMRLYNLTDDIINSQIAFNKFYGIIDRDSSEYRREIAEEYAREHSFSMIKNDVLDL